jgi:alanine racemase
MFKAWIKRALSRQYLPLNTVEISAANLVSNYNYLSSLNKRIKVAPVLKSNAYGHGLVEAAGIVDRVEAPFICVDSLYEAYELYKANIKTKILIMGYADPENLRFKKLPFSFAVYSLEHLIALVRVQPRAKIHLFVDTGMGREGIPVDEFEGFMRKMPSRLFKNIEGLMSHFAASDKFRDPKTINQVKNFRRSLRILNEKGIKPKWVHIANSSGLLNSDKLGIGAFTNMARCGISLYGVDPEGKNKRLKRVAKLLTHISQIKEIKKGGSVGYDFTYIAKKDIKTAVLPIGYNDGVDRELSNKGIVYVLGYACPILGRVSMNLTVIDITSVSKAKVGDVAEIEYFIDSKTKIPYEFMVHLNPKIKRIVV